MARLRTPKLRRNEDGAAIVEFALVLPVLVMFIWGISQFGMIMAADAGIQNGLGEGARMATLYPTPATTAIKQKMQNSLFGQFLGSYTIADPDVQDVLNADGNRVGRYMDLTITYRVTPNFLFFNGPLITMPRSKRVYLNF